MGKFPEQLNMVGCLDLLDVIYLKNTMENARSVIGMK